MRKILAVMIMFAMGLSFASPAHAKKPAKIEKKAAQVEKKQIRKARKAERKAKKAELKQTRKQALSADKQKPAESTVVVTPIPSAAGTE